MTKSRHPEIAELRQVRIRKIEFELFRIRAHSTRYTRSVQALFLRLYFCDKIITMVNSEFKNILEQQGKLLFPQQPTSKQLERARLERLSRKQAVKDATNPIAIKSPVEDKHLPATENIGIEPPTFSSSPPPGEIKNQAKPQKPWSLREALKIENGLKSK